MTRFQWMAGTVLLSALVREVIRLRTAVPTRRATLVRLAVWLTALIAICDPQLVTRFANALGIGRGADAVLYLFALAFVATSFYFYSRQVKLQRQITALASHLAIADARRGPASPPAP
jgi:hypothetical protein